MRTDHRGFSLIELLIVVTIILIIAAIAVPNLMRSRIAANQASAVQSCRVINSAQVAYNTSYNQGYATTLAVLGPPTTGAQPTPSAAGLLDSLLTSGFKSGYAFTYVPLIPDANGNYQGYMINADPVAATTGTAHYYTDQSYVIRGNNTSPASVADSPVGD
jgi:prepilin-type N-terminal cleavage/methylation domain-containing protein